MGDVTDKGVPAALVMARTHSILRGDAPRLVSPARVLAHANDLLVAEMPEKMFVTCLYMVFDPATGHVVFANAGHNLPYVRTAAGVIEFRATGMPLGLLPGMDYEEREADIEPGANVLLYSDGLVEAHDPAGDMYGFPRLRAAMAGDLSGGELIDDLLDGCTRSPAAAGSRRTTSRWSRSGDRPGARATATGSTTTTTRPRAGSGPDVGPARRANAARLRAPRRPRQRAPGDGAGRRGGRPARPRAGPPGAPQDRRQRGRDERDRVRQRRRSPDVPVGIEVATTDHELRVRITDRALGGPIPGDDAEEPDIEAKLAGLQKARGWGLFLIRHMVDRVEVTPGDGRQTVTLTLDLQGGRDARTPA